ncbi:MAG TPA: hypothetical protein ENH15_01955 [Actinobacteria bacterium]|nr:hypothetical protein [Actinomycetota bacterium]
MAPLELVFSWSDFQKLAALAGAASTDAARPSICRVHLSPNPETGILEAAATDSYVLAWRTFNNVAVPDGLDVTFPAKDLTAFVNVATAIIKRHNPLEVAVEVVINDACTEGSWSIPSLKWEFKVDPTKYPTWRPLRIRLGDKIDALQALARKTQRADLIIAIYDTRWITTEFKEWRLDQDDEWARRDAHDALYAIASKVTRKAIVEWVAALTRPFDATHGTAAVNSDYLHRLSKTFRIPKAGTRLLTISIETSLDPIRLSSPGDPAWGAVQMPTRI